MRSFVATLMLLTLTSMSASAEVRLLNWTGKELSVDVLHQSGPVRQVVVSSARSVTGPIGPKTSRQTSEMLVVRTADGQELLRSSVSSGNIYVIEKRSSGYYTSHAGFYGGSAKHSTLKIMNGTGQKLAYHYETPEFRVRKNKLDPGTLRAWNIGTENSYEIGAPMKVKLGLNNPSQEFQFQAGNVYLITNENGALKATEIGKD